MLETTSDPSVDLAIDLPTYLPSHLNYVSVCACTHTCIGK